MRYIETHNNDPQKLNLCMDLINNINYMAKVLLQDYTLINE